MTEDLNDRLDTPNDAREETATDTSAVADKGRRKALGKLAYAAPVVATLAVSTKAKAFTPPPPPGSP